MLSVTASLNSFFDRERVISATNKATRRVLSKFGAFVRTRARTSIRKRKGVSAPGAPPHSHEGTLKRFLFFAYDVQRSSVVIGPAKTNQIFVDGYGLPKSGTVPGVLEYGGVIGIIEWFRGGKWYRADLRSRRRIREENIPLRQRDVKIAARPFMGPAYEAELPGLPAMWRDSVR
jgi:hypothetical protein